VKIGNDVGTGTESDPELPTLDTTAADMNVLYELDDDVTINYVDNLTISYSIFLSGGTNGTILTRPSRLSGW
jgi:hypothetical protein